MSLLPDSANSVGAVVLTMMWIGCQGSSADESTDSGTQESRPETDCSQLSGDRCIGDDRCTPATGAPVNETARCLGTEVFLACIEKSSECSSVSYARDPHGQLWRLSRGCVPPGWHVEHANGPEVEANCVPEPDDECVGLSKTECIESEHCVPVGGGRVNLSGRCLEPEDFVICWGQSCSNGLSFMRDHDGELWHIACVSPAGWVAEEPVELVDWLYCREPDPEDWCSQLAESDCYDEEGGQCAALYGGHINADRGCYDTVRFLGCSTQPICGQSFTCASDPTGEVWEFADTCTPPGWPQVLDCGSGYYESCR